MKFALYDGTRIERMRRIFSDLECSRLDILGYEFYEFYEFSNFSNLECSRLDILSYEFYELTNFSNLECSYVGVLQISKIRKFVKFVA